MKPSEMPARACLVSGLAIYWTFVLALLDLLVHPVNAQDQTRIATFNTSLYRNDSGELIRELKSGESKQAHLVAEILQTVRPDIVLLNEFDFDAKGEAVQCFQKQYLSKSHGNQKPLIYRYHYAPPVNTGVQSGFDLDQDEKTGGPGDAWGFGRHPGQYGLVVLSRFPIEVKKVRTFRKFRWKDMPDAQLPKNIDGTEYYPKQIRETIRLSSKNHCDVVIKKDDQVLHFLISHPTPPVFDGKEDRNGKRNHDEIRFWNDYVTPGKNEYIYDDLGQKGGFVGGEKFVIAGDLNADPHDGDSSGNPIGMLEKNRLVNFNVRPSSIGAKAAGKAGKANLRHVGDHSLDTADFNDEAVGNLRIDYVLPSNNLTVSSAGVFWPAEGKPGANLIKASDHRLVWIDVKF